jgi:tetratricopeptide (TPR) repeat protein
MIFCKKPAQDKEKIESKALALFHKQRWEKALELFAKLIDLDPSHTGYLEKAIECQQNKSTEWTEDDFSRNLTWQMQLQELRNPLMRLTHAKLEASFEEDLKKIHALIQESDQERFEDTLRSLIIQGDSAFMACLEFLSQLRKEIVMHDPVATAEPPSPTDS